MRRTSTSSLKQAVWIATLILSLLFAQFAGLQHRIDHAGWQGDPGMRMLNAQLGSGGADQSSTDSSKKSASHSCAIFDAATLADTFNATPCTLVLALNTDAAPTVADIASWDAPALVHFLSRAPPTVTI